MKQLKQLVALVAIFAATAAFMSMTFSVNDWEVPAKYKSMTNPKAKAGDPDGIGADLYKQHCASCHGKEGYGDGKKASTLKAKLRDFTSDEVQQQKDGELYYKSFIGKDEMPNFEKKIKGDDRWYVINYMRILAK